MRDETFFALCRGQLLPHRAAHASGAPLLRQHLRPACGAFVMAVFPPFRDTTCAFERRIERGSKIRMWCEEVIDILYFFFKFLALYFFFFIRDVRVNMTFKIWALACSFASYSDHHRGRGWLQDALTWDNAPIKSTLGISGRGNKSQRFGTFGFY